MIPYPYGYTVTPLPPPIHWVWQIGLVTTKTSVPTPTGTTGPFQRGSITMQLTADQQVALSIRAEDAYDNPVEITGDVTWLSSDESIITVTADSADNTKATAAAVGPVGTASVTVTNDVNRDGTGDFMGSLAIDVVAGTITEIVVVAGEPEDKP